MYDNIWRHEVLDDWQISSTRLRWQSPADVNLGLSQPRRNGDFDTCLCLSAANATIPWLIPFSIKRYCKLQPEFKRKDAPHLRSVLTYPRMLGSTTEITHLIGDRGNSHQFAHSRPSETPARQLGECTELGSSIDVGCGWMWMILGLPSLPLPNLLMKWWYLQIICSTFMDIADELWSRPLGSTEACFGTLTQQVASLYPNKGDSKVEQWSQYIQRCPIYSKWSPKKPWIQQKSTWLALYTGNTFTLLLKWVAWSFYLLRGSANVFRSTGLVI